jgi:hypothetical protein
LKLKKFKLVLQEMNNRRPLKTMAMIRNRKQRDRTQRILAMRRIKQVMKWDRTRTTLK